jgi:hypothetical protein
VGRALRVVEELLTKLDGVVSVRGATLLAMTPATPVCPWCGLAAPLIWVHGHAQCSRCGVNAEPCCQGAETCPATLETERDDDVHGDA